MGGQGGVRTVKPGERWDQRLLLQVWCEVDKPGEYTVTAGQDIGWDEPVEDLSSRDWRRSRGGSFTIELVEPSEEDARAVLDAMVAGVRTSDNVWRAKQPFAYIRHPAYLEPLRELASDANRDVREVAIDGIGSILTPKATLALIGLLKHANRETARLAAQTLNWRLPHPNVWQSADARSPFRFDENRAKQAEAVRLAWRDEFGDRVLAHARKLLRSDDKDDIRSGVYVVRCFEDAPSMDLFLSAVERYVLLEQAGDPEWPKYGFAFMSRGRWAATARALVDAGAPQPRVGRIDTVGKALVWLYLVQGAGHRPRGWQEEYLRCLAHPNSLVRLVAVDKLPEELVPRAAERLVALANDSHETVRRRTWAVAMRLKIREFLPVVLERVRRETTKTALDQACAVCVALGDTSHVDILIERITGPSVALPVHLILYGKTTDSGCGYRTDSQWTEAELAKLQKEWREWFRANAEALGRHGRLRPSDERLTPRPTPRDFRINR